MPRHASHLECSAETRAELVAISRSRTGEVRMVERARIVLACLEGKEIQQVAQEASASVPTVSKWRSRFARDGIRGLRDRARSGKPPTYDAAFRDRVLALLEQAPPAGQAQWDGPAVAKRLGASVHAVWRVLRREGIYLQRLRTWCVSTDPEFATKAAEVVGLYLNPPLNALVLSVDEKPSIQAIQRPSGYVETQIFAQTSEEKKREDFRRFLDAVLAELPTDKEIHVILDNYSTHKRNADWLDKYQGRVQFHFTPTSASWLNQVEIWFGLLTRKALRGASFASKDQLRSAIESFVTNTNQHPKPFHWRKREVKGSQLRNTIINLCN